MNLADIKYIKNRLVLLRKISHLSIEKAGIEDEMPYVKLKNGPVFYGIKSPEKHRKYYNLLSNKLQKQLPFECFMVANDIIIRYKEGGLMYGGPRKEHFYKVKSNDVVAEMGSFLGHYTIYLSERVGEKGTVIAIEPIPENIKVLKKNIEANNLQNVKIVPKGVWKQSGEMNFAQKSDDNQSGSVEIHYEDGNSFLLPVDSLDNILTECNVQHIDFMIIQLNGVEIDALNGLTKFSPKNLSIAARYNKREEDAPLLIHNLLVKRNYTTHILKQKFVYASLE